jgi:dTDP-4-dehydrorhamnose reductase
LLPVDVSDREQVAAAFQAARPHVVVHAAALARVADCHRDPARAHRINVRGTAILAELCLAAGTRLVLTSTDMVFSGERGHYREDDPPAPLSEYGRTKAAAEKVALAVPTNAIIRLSLMYGPSVNGGPSFFVDQVAALRAGRPITLFEDEWRTPLDLRTAARAVLAVARSEYRGLLHVGGPERLSRVDMGRRLAAYLQVDPSSIVVTSRLDAPAAEPRPRDLSLDSSRWRQQFPDHPWPRWEEALRDLDQGEKEPRMNTDEHGYHYRATRG